MSIKNNLDQNGNPISDEKQQKLKKICIGLLKATNVKRQHSNVDRIIDDPKPSKLFKTNLIKNIKFKSKKSLVIGLVFMIIIFGFVFNNNDSSSSVNTSSLESTDDSSSIADDDTSNVENSADDSSSDTTSSDSNTPSIQGTNLSINTDMLYFNRYDPDNTLQTGSSLSIWEDWAQNSNTAWSDDFDIDERARINLTKYWGFMPTNLVFTEDNCIYVSGVFSNLSDGSKFENIRNIKMVLLDDYYNVLATYYMEDVNLTLNPLETVESQCFVISNVGTLDSAKTYSVIVAADYDYLHTKESTVNGSDPFKKSVTQQIIDDYNEQQRDELDDFWNDRGIYKNGY